MAAGLWIVSRESQAELLTQSHAGLFSKMAALSLGEPPHEPQLPGQMS